MRKHCQGATVGWSRQGGVWTPRCPSCESPGGGSALARIGFLGAICGSASATAPASASTQACQRVASPWALAPTWGSLKEGQPCLHPATSVDTCVLKSHSACRSRQASAQPSCPLESGGCWARLKWMPLRSPSAGSPRTCAVESASRTRGFGADAATLPGALRPGSRAAHQGTLASCVEMRSTLREHAGQRLTATTPAISSPAQTTSPSNRPA